MKDDKSRRRDPNARIDPATITEMTRAGTGLDVITQLMTEGWLSGMVITEIRVKGPDPSRDGFMAVIKARDDYNQPYVAFRTAGSVRELVSKIAGDVQMDRLQLKEEQPYDPSGEKAKAKAQKSG